MTIFRLPCISVLSPSESDVMPAAADKQQSLTRVMIQNAVMGLGIVNGDVIFIVVRATTTDAWERLGYHRLTVRVRFKPIGTPVGRAEVSLY